MTGGPKCRMLNFRNGYVNCQYFSNFHVDFKMVSCHMSNIYGLCHVDNIFSHVDSMSPVDFRKWPCRPVDFKGQGGEADSAHSFSTSHSHILL